MGAQWVIELLSTLALFFASVPVALYWVFLRAKPDMACQVRALRAAALRSACTGFDLDLVLGMRARAWCACRRW